ncbi:MAG: FAD-dependent oxidoreductase [Candidatus Gastranaerophilaceae bacterium]|jgi:alkyl hydroperoxide reductase subunit F
MYDVIIIGSGPAGFTSAIYAARREMKTLIIGREIGGQMVWASEIENYPGFKSIESFELISKMQDQVTGLGVEIKNTEVKKIVKNADENFIVYTEKEEFITKTIILAMGLSPRRLEIEGELKFNSKGVSYCANCDGPFYKDKIIAVVGGGNSALDAAEVLSKIAKKVFLIHRNQTFKAFEVLIDEVKNRSNIEIMLDSEISQIIGSNLVEKILVKNVINGAISEIDLGGVFIEVGRIAKTDLVSEFVERDMKNQIIVDEKCRTKTNGIFAAGDVTTTEYKQITVAIGQATVAALSAYQYLQLRHGKKTGAAVDRSTKKVQH